MKPLLAWTWLQHKRAGPSALLNGLKWRFTGLLLLAAGIIMAQEATHRFGIHRNGKKIGVLTLSVSSQGGEQRLLLTSLVHTRFLTSFSIRAEEESRFQRNTLVFTSIRRWINGREQEHKVLTAEGSGFRVTNGGATTRLHHPPVRCNILTLYAWEPRLQTRVFSDSHLQLLTLDKAGPGHYQVRFPDGKMSEFWYVDGRCHRILLHSRWYTAELVSEDDRNSFTATKPLL